MARKDKIISLKPIFEKDGEKSFYLNVLFTKEGFEPDITDVPEEEREAAAEKWSGESGYESLYFLGLRGKPLQETLSVNFLLQITASFFKQLTALPGLWFMRERAAVTLSDEEAARLLDAVPFAVGAEYIDRTWIENIYLKLQKIFAREISEWQGSVESYFFEKSSAFSVPQRFTFYLTERSDRRFPFAFFVTYMTEAEGEVREVPLKSAICALEKTQEDLVPQLAGLAKAAVVSPVIDLWMKKGELLYPLALTKEEAYLFLKQTDSIEKAGISCKVPAWWKNKSSEITICDYLGRKENRDSEMETKFYLRSYLAVDKQPLSEKEIDELRKETQGIRPWRESWIQTDYNHLSRLLKKIKKEERTISLSELLRLEIGAGRNQTDLWEKIILSKNFSHYFEKLRHPENLEEVSIPETLKVSMQPYQQAGYTWLCNMDYWGMGAYLADDMELNKPLQALAYLEKLRLEKSAGRVLLVTRTVRLGDWEKWINDYTPQMKVCLLSENQTANAREKFRKSDAFLFVVPYILVTRLRELQKVEWECILLDEAQEIKRPETIRAEFLKTFNSRMRVAMSSIPIENNLIEFWSVFEFLNKGMLGTPAEFRDFFIKIRENSEYYAHFRMWLAPFLLRRSKKDRSITPVSGDCFKLVHKTLLAKKQWVLYRKATGDMRRQLLQVSGEKRQDVVMETAKKLWQILNHPDQYLQRHAYLTEESGKFLMLKEICEIIYQKREKAAVIVRMKEIIPPLNELLTDIFHASGWVFTDNFPPEKQQKLFADFQNAAAAPFLLFPVKEEKFDITKINTDHLIFFDWLWEQEKNTDEKEAAVSKSGRMTIHKLVCKGTLEEKMERLSQPGKTIEEILGDMKREKDRRIAEYDDAELFAFFRVE